MESNECNDHVIPVIGENLHKLEELSLGLIGEDRQDAIQCLVKGCPRLKVLQVGYGSTIEAVQTVMCGLKKLVVFEEPLMLLAMNEVLRKNRKQEFKSLSNIFMDDEDSLYEHMPINYGAIIHAIKSMRHLPITIVRMHLHFADDDKLNFGDHLSKLNNLTELRLEAFNSYARSVSPVINQLGHQLTVIDLKHEDLFEDYDLISEIPLKCKNVRILRLNFGDDMYFTKDYDLVNGNVKTYGHNLEEKIQPFINLEVLELSGFLQYCVPSNVFKSMLASPGLKSVNFCLVPNLTDHVIKSVLNHKDENGHALAFTSLKHMKLKRCNFVTNTLKTLVCSEKVPLESLSINNCRGVTKQHLWNIGHVYLNEKFPSLSLDSSNSDFDYLDDSDYENDPSGYGFDGEDFGDYDTFGLDGSFDYSTAGQRGAGGLFWHKAFCYDM